ncbi:uncharacterized protein [Macrobrachium rosenbergii]|uniref:uncharacterized protein isoform X2 n=1 Tax=Macrobrachium rosenbergii TaxID=79674 RepID=UPI0034D47A75
MAANADMCNIKVMGKNSSRKQRMKMAKARKKTVKSDLDSMSISELLTHAQEQIDSYKFEKAQRYCQEALKRDPDNVVALETSASLCLEVGNFDGAKHCLGRAITLQPEEGYSKYLSMAQLLQGKESLQCYLKGIELMQLKLSNLQPTTANENTVNSVGKLDEQGETEMETVTTRKEEESTEETEEEQENEPPSSSSSQDENQSMKSALVHQMSSAYCSVAELFMTDLCDEEDAENQCHTNISKAIDVDPGNPEAYQSMASFLLVKQETEQAKENILKSLELWLPKYKAVDEGVAAAGSFDPVEVCPLSYPTRLNTAKILIEVEDHDHAVDVLEGLAEEDDSVVDTWYLMGWSAYLRGEEHRDNARYLLHRAMEVHKANPSDDVQLVEHLEELLAELGPLPEDQTLDEGDTDGELEESEDDEPEDMDTN